MSAMTPDEISASQHSAEFFAWEDSKADEQRAYEAWINAARAADKVLPRDWTLVHELRLDDATDAYEQARETSKAAWRRLLAGNELPETARE